jgi:hypothetical protein
MFTGYAQQAVRLLTDCGNVGLEMGFLLVFREVFP